MSEDYWIDFVLNKSTYGHNNEFFNQLLDSEQARLHEKPADAQIRDNCAKICRAILDKRVNSYNVSDDIDEFYKVFNVCMSAGRKDLAQKAVRAYPCRIREQLTTLLKYFKASGWNDLSASAIAVYRCAGTEDFLAVAECCRNIGREDMVVDLVKAQPCDNKATLLAVFDCCMELERLDLASQAIEKFYAKAVKPGSVTLLAFQATVVSLIAPCSEAFPFADWIGCLDLAFKQSKSFANCHSALRDLSERWTYHNIGDAPSFRIWKRICRDGVLDKCTSLSEDDAVAIQQTISEEGNSWITDSSVLTSLKSRTIADMLQVDTYCNAKERTRLHVFCFISVSGVREGTSQSYSCCSALFRISCTDDCEN